MQKINDEHRELMEQFDKTLDELRTLDTQKNDKKYPKIQKQLDECD